MLLVGGTLLVGMLVVVLIYAVYRMLRGTREGMDMKPTAPHPQDESAFMVAALQGVISRMKAEENKLREMLRESEQCARANARVLENIVRELPLGVMAFNREGFLTLSNPAVRTLLGIDTWSRRRYPEILGAESTLTECIRECLEAGKDCKGRAVEYRMPAGDLRTLEVSLSLLFSGGGQIDGALCILREQAPD